jgi:predicted MPP superfamily phosphohydrolase
LIDMELPISFMKFFLSVFIPPQLYLFLRLRGYVSGKAFKPCLRAGFLSVAAIVFTLMPAILAWQAILGHDRIGAHSHLRRLLLSASITWGVGSIACAALLFLYSLFRGANPFRGHDAGSPRPDPGRRQFLQQFAGVAAIAPFVLSGSGAAAKRGQFDIDHFNVPVEGLTSALVGFTVVQLTDIHVGPFMTADELAGFVEATNLLKPDLIVLTGDFITGSPVEVAPCVETLAGLKACNGIFACIGNHEIHANAEELLTQGLEASGIRVLRNHGVSVPVGDTRLAVLGIDDLRAGKPDLYGALGAIQEDGGEAKILLSHRPEIFPWASRAGIDLILSGHYHGGQIKLGRHPESLSVARFLTPYAEGFFQMPRAASRHESDKRRSTLFVGRGVGISGLPLRVNCAPQIAHLTLKKA